MTLVAIQALNGLVYAMLLFLTAAGLSLIFGLMNVVSLAHGSFFMLGAFLGLAIFQVTDNFWLALLLAPVATALVGVLMETIFLRPLYRRGHLDQVLLTFGFTFVFFDLVQIFWGRDIRSMAPPEILAGVTFLADIPFPTYRLFLVGLGVLLAGLLWIGMERTRIGAMVRAAVDDAFTASGLGINTGLLFTSVFGAGVALAGLAGVAAAPVFGLYPGMDVEILIPAFLVIVIGGMGTLKGAFIGSLLIGQADTFGKAYLPSTAMFLIYVVMAVILLVRPQGFFGILRTHSAPEPSLAVNPFRPEAKPPHLVTLLILVALIVYPLVVGSYPRQLLAEIFIFAILAMSLDLLLGFTGLMSLGHAAFFGLGAYGVVLLGTHWNINAWAGLIAGIGLASLGAAIIGFFCIRTRGVTFLMLTMAFSQLLFSAALKWRELTGGSDGISLSTSASLFGFSLSGPLQYYVMLASFLATAWFLRHLLRSPLGHVFVGIRENEDRMRALGYATGRYKLLSFTIGGTLAGLAGGLYALFNGFISPDAMFWMMSGDILIMVTLGGVGTLAGSVIGAAIFLLTKNIVSTYSTHWMLIIGTAFIACVMFFPGGIWGAAANVLRRKVHKL